MKIGTVRKYALSLPEATEAPHFQYSSFRVMGKIFVTVPPDEEHIHVFVGEEVREPALALHNAFLEKLMWGGKVVGLRVNLRAAEALIVTRLISQAWLKAAPKGLQAAAAGVIAVDAR